MAIQLLGWSINHIIQSSSTSTHQVWITQSGRVHNNFYTLLPIRRWTSLLITGGLTEHSVGGKCTFAPLTLPTGKWGLPSGSGVKKPPAKQETQVQSLGQKEPLEMEMTAHSSLLAWETPWTRKPGRLQS